MKNLINAGFDPEDAITIIVGFFSYLHLSTYLNSINIFFAVYGINTDYFWIGGLGQFVTFIYQVIKDLRDPIKQDRKPVVYIIINVAQIVGGGLFSMLFASIIQTYIISKFIVPEAGVLISGAVAALIGAFWQDFYLKIEKLSKKKTVRK